MQLRLQNIKAFHELNLSFQNSNGDPRPWTVLLGDNASGKTTVLRCLAIGMNDESSAAGLVRETKGSMVRGTPGKKRAPGMILVGLIDSKGRPWTIKTVLTPIPKTGDLIRQRVYNLPADQVPDGPFPSKEQEKGIVDTEAFPWEQIFVCGYGAGRSIDGREEYTDYRTIDAVYTLFRYDQPLQSPELAWRRYRQRWLQRRGRVVGEKQAIVSADKWVATMLAEIMGLRSSEHPVLRESGIFLGPSRRRIPLADQADGYRSITTWLLDFISWYLLFRSGIRLDSVNGIILVDEIEQHLHPRWQRYLIGRLAKQFSGVQFIATTHSPLCAASAADLTAEQCAMTRLEYDSVAKCAHANEQSLPYGYRADQILMSSAFGLRETINPEIGDLLSDIRRLFRKGRLSSADRAEMKTKREFLKELAPQLLGFEDEAGARSDLMSLIKEAQELRAAGGDR